jgi:thymidylate synthase ThyX
MYACRIEADSVSGAGHRLTTFVVSYPRFIHSEVMTHRVFSRNAASSRAIPIQKMIERVMSDPAEPVSWGKNQKGMQADEELDMLASLAAQSVWHRAMRQAVAHAREMVELGVHKQIANRLLEPFAWMETIITATEWENFFNLRTHKDAQPEFQHLAKLMKAAYESSAPSAVYGEGWHLPFVTQDELGLEIGEESLEAMLISAGRCARVSYLTHDGRRNLGEDIALAKRLQASGHMSPFEHVARPMTKDELWYTDPWYAKTMPAELQWLAAQRHMCGNFRGWVQYRKTMMNEAVWRQEEK